jgi:hypothetical protein
MNSPSTIIAVVIVIVIVILIAINRRLNTSFGVKRFIPRERLDLPQMRGVTVAVSRAAGIVWVRQAVPGVANKIWVSEI